MPKRDLLTHPNGKRSQAGLWVILGISLRHSYISFSPSFLSGVNLTPRLASLCGWKITTNASQIYLFPSPGSLLKEWEISFFQSFLSLWFSLVHHDLRSGEGIILVNLGLSLELQSDVSFLQYLGIVKGRCGYLKRETWMTTQPRVDDTVFITLKVLPANIVTARSCSFPYRLIWRI